MSQTYYGRLFGKPRGNHPSASGNTISHTIGCSPYLGHAFLNRFFFSLCPTLSPTSVLSHDTSTCGKNVLKLQHSPYCWLYCFVLIVFGEIIEPNDLTVEVKIKSLSRLLTPIEWGGARIKLIVISTVSYSRYL